MHHSGIAMEAQFARERFNWRVTNIMTEVDYELAVLLIFEKDQISRIERYDRLRIFRENELQPLISNLQAQANCNPLFPSRGPLSMWNTLFGFDL